MKSILGTAEFLTILLFAYGATFWFGYLVGCKRENESKTLKFVLDSRKIDPHPIFSTMTWRFLHDCFVFLLHGFLKREHCVILDCVFIPPRPICITCEEKKNGKI